MSGLAARGLAGALNRPVTLLRRSAARDDLGGASGDWTVFASAWAALTPDGTAPVGEGDRSSGRPRWRAVLRPVAILVGDRMQGIGRTMAVLRIEADPATPDRITLWLEEIA